MALKSSKQLEEERRKARRLPPKLGATAAYQAPKPSPLRKRGLTIGLVAVGAMTIFGVSSWERQPNCQPNPIGDQTCQPGSGSTSSGSRSFFSSWGSSSGYSSGSYWGRSSSTSGTSTALASRGGFGSTGGSHASSGG